MASPLTRHVILPLVVTTALIAMYFSGNGWLQGLVAPQFDYTSHGREFGILENLQHLLLLICIVFCWKGFRGNVAVLRSRWIWLCVAVAFAFLLLEEIDYGIHYYEFLNRELKVEEGQMRNLHNQGEVTRFLKRIETACVIAFFVVFPFIPPNRLSAFWSRLQPTRWFVGTCIVMIICSKAAHLLHDLGFAGKDPLNSNVSEFRELVLYYLFANYLFELVFRNNRLATTQPNQTHISV